MAEHLVGLGHTSLAMVEGQMSGKMDVSIWELRAAGFLHGLAEAGIDPAGVLRLRPGDCHTADGERVGDQLLASSQPLPRAVFCQSDELAFGLIASLRRAGVQCPRDISVAGFDDHPMARLWDLTTIDQHAHAQGVRAALALLDIVGVGGSGERLAADAGRSAAGRVDHPRLDGTGRHGRYNVSVASLPYQWISWSAACAWIRIRLVNTNR